jgi:hypothetical protein
MNEFKGIRRTYWLIGVAIMVVGVMTALVLLPAFSPTRGTGGPDIRVPKMQNVPPAGAPRMRLDLEDKR